MARSSSFDVTRTLLDLRAGKISSAEATDRIFELVYEELRRIAGGLMRDERPDHTLQATALVHEAYRRLVDQTRIEWQSRAHFFGIAARAMRQILVDHARRRARAKRCGGWQRVSLDERLEGLGVSDFEIVDLDEILTRLAALDERMARLVELRVFGGLTVNEAAQVLGVSRGTVLNDWRVAKTWLAREFRAGCES